MEYMESKMQEQYDAAEAEYNELCERLMPPHDWQSPLWGVANRAHNWRNYASKDLKAQWPHFSGRMRLIIAANLNDIAMKEEWD